jgi:hypothetical protein
MAKMTPGGPGGKALGSQSDAVVVKNLAEIISQEGREFSGHADVEDENGHPVLHFAAKFKRVRER